MRSNECIRQCQLVSHAGSLSPLTGKTKVGSEGDLTTLTYIVAISTLKHSRGKLSIASVIASPSLWLRYIDDTFVNWPHNVYQMKELNQ